MNASGAPGGDGHNAHRFAGEGQHATLVPSLGQLKEALRVLEQTQQLFNNMKAKVVYACGEGHLLAADEGRQYLARVIKSLDDEHRLIRSGWPRLAAALDVARTVNKASAARTQSSSGGGAQGQGGRSQAAGAAAEASSAAAAAAALQGHCRSVVQQLEAAVCEELLASGGGLLVQRRAKRPRTGDVLELPAITVGGTAVSSPGTSPAASSPVAFSYSTAASVTPTGGSQEVLEVLLRMRALDGSSAAIAGGAAASLGGMKVHVLDDGGNPLSLPSALTAALMTAAAASSSGGSGGGLPQVDGVLIAAGAARLGSATQVRMLLPGVFVANVLLEAPGCAAPLRVAVDTADKAFELDPWATPTTQVFRRLSALATRVLNYYIKRSPLSAVARPAAPAPAPAALPADPSTAGAAALEDLLLWLLSFRDLFSKRCTATGRLMAWDPSVQFPVPPIFRVFKLPREELRLRAMDLARVPAYHMHVAPVEQLGWEEDVPAEAIVGRVVGGHEAAATARTTAGGV